MTVEYYVQTGRTIEVLAALREMSALIQSDEPGCTGYEVLRSNDVEDRLLLIETYVDDAALAAHRETPHFKEILEKRVIPLLVNRVRHHYSPEISLG
jgi:autoinducer 2-degrading protein